MLDEDLRPLDVADEIGCRSMSASRVRQGQVPEAGVVAAQSVHQDLDLHGGVRDGIPCIPTPFCVHGSDDMYLLAPVGYVPHWGTAPSYLAVIAAQYPVAPPL